MSGFKIYATIRLEVRRKVLKIGNEIIGNRTRGGFLKIRWPPLERPSLISFAGRGSEGGAPLDLGPEEKTWAKRRLASWRERLGQDGERPGLFNENGM